jgi:hypothetical protein
MSSALRSLLSLQHPKTTLELISQLCRSEKRMSQAEGTENVMINTLLKRLLVISKLMNHASEKDVLDSLLFMRLRLMGHKESIIRQRF